VAEWFVGRFGTPTEPQEYGWPHILAGRTTLISAPTGSGKTLAAFLACIDRLVRKALAGDLADRTAEATAAHSGYYAGIALHFAHRR
jgi:ATP-dependent Lhr-like helicase